MAIVLKRIKALHLCKGCFFYYNYKYPCSKYFKKDSAYAEHCKGFIYIKQNIKILRKV